MSSKDCRERRDQAHADDLHMDKPCDHHAATHTQLAQGIKKKKMQKAGCPSEDSSSASSFECVPAASSECAVATKRDVSHCQPHHCHEDNMQALCSLSDDFSFSPSSSENKVGMPCYTNYVPPIKRLACGESSAPASMSSPKSKQQKEEERPEDDANEIDSTECVTPRAPEHRIPDPPEACPAPPRKKPRRSEHIVGRVGQNTGAAAASPLDEARISARQLAAVGFPFFNPPPDLHTYPDCIRALFES